MRRPLDPRNHGLKKPEKVLSKTDRIYLSDLDNEEKVHLRVLVDAWNKILKDLESQGHRVTEGPYFEVESYYGRSNSLVYTYEWDNLNYSVEKAEYDAAIAAYEKELAEWKVFEEERKKNLDSGIPKTIDLQILRAEHRLANLKAVKAGQPLPFPEG